MNVTSEQTTVVMAAVAAVDRLLSGTGVRIDEDRFIWKDKYLYLCTSSEGQDSTSHLPHTAMSSFPLVETQSDTGRISLS